MTIEDAIKDLEDRKALMMNTCPQRWDPAIDMALNGLKLIKQLSDDLDELINESKDIYRTELDSDDLVDCENYTRLKTYGECRHMLKELKHDWRIN